jgi:rubrerythrin
VRQRDANYTFGNALNVGTPSSSLLAEKIRKSSKGKQENTMNYTLPIFLAHALALEQEAADRYLELADMMEAHHNDKVSQVFREMSHFSELHRDSIRARVGEIEVPKLKSWEYRWRMPPEVGDEDAFDYLLEPYHALMHARANEVRGLKYYQEVADAAEDPHLRAMASEFAQEEREHVLALDRWLSATLRPLGGPTPDPLALEHIS